MRLYTRLKPIGSGITASPNNKGLLLCNPGSATTMRSVYVNILNFDNTITGITLAAYDTSAVNQVLPNYVYVPFTITSWTDASSGISMNGFELF